MSTFTENYGLIKPGEADYYDIADWNENMDTLDEALAAQDRTTAEIGEKMGSPTTEGATLFSLLEGNGGGLIKSMQTVDFSFQSDQTVTEEINPVNPAKCFVHMERIFDPTGYEAKLLYTLTENSISIIPTSSTINPVEMYVRFQIIEFY